MNFAKQDQKQASREACQVLVHGLPDEAVMKGKIAPLTAKELVERNSLARLFRARSWIVLLVGFVATFCIAHVVYQSEKHAMQLRFEAATQKFVDAVYDRMDVHRQILRGYDGFFAASNEVTAWEWQKYYNKVRVNDSYPCILTIGFIALVEPGKEADFEKEAADLGQEGFRVWPEQYQGIDHRASLLFVEPMTDENRKMIGFDPYTKASRREALDRSRRTGEFSISGKLVLLQDIDDYQTGFLVMLPVYHRGVNRLPEEERRQALRGWVASGVRANEFMEAVAESVNEKISYRLYDGTAETSVNLMDTDSRFERDAEFSKIESLVLGGRQWSIEFASLPEFEQGFHPMLSYFVLCGGLLSTCLLAGMFSVSRKTEQLAVSIAEELTDNIRSREVEILRLNRSLEKKVQERTRELQRTNMELEDYTYTITHDLRAPLRTIKGFAEILHDECKEQLDEEAQQLLGRIETSAVVMGEMITDTLSLAKMSNGQIDREEMNLSAMANSIFLMLKSGDRNHEVAVRVRRNMTLDADRKIIEIVLRNLIENAWKFTRNEQEPAIEVGEMTLNDHRTFFVKDNGTGFDDSNADEIFRPFRRLHLVQEFEGTGMGMAIARRMIQKHRGRIWAESKKGEGATFFFTVDEY